MRMLTSLSVYLLASLISGLYADSSSVELYCIDSICSVPFATGVVISTIETRHGIIKKDSQVQIVGKGVTSKNSLMRIQLDETYFLLDSSFVKETSPVDIKSLVKSSINIMDTQTTTIPTSHNSDDNLEVIPTSTHYTPLVLHQHGPPISIESSYSPYVENSGLSGVSTLSSKQSTKVDMSFDDTSDVTEMRAHDSLFADNSKTVLVPEQSAPFEDSSTLSTSKAYVSDNVTQTLASSADVVTFEESSNDHSAFVVEQEKVGVHDTSKFVRTPEKLVNHSGPNELSGVVRLSHEKHQSTDGSAANAQGIFSAAIGDPHWTDDTGPQMLTVSDSKEDAGITSHDLDSISSNSLSEAVHHPDPLDSQLSSPPFIPGVSKAHSDTKIASVKPIDVHESVNMNESSTPAVSAIPSLSTSDHALGTDLETRHSFGARDDLDSSEHMSSISLNDVATVVTPVFQTDRTNTSGQSTENTSGSLSLRINVTSNISLSYTADPMYDPSPYPDNKILTDVQNVVSFTDTNVSINPANSEKPRNTSSVTIQSDKNLVEDTHSLTTQAGSSASLVMNIESVGEVEMEAKPIEDRQKEVTGTFVDAEPSLDVVEPRADSTSLEPHQIFSPRVSADDARNQVSLDDDVSEPTKRTTDLDGSEIHVYLNRSDTAPFSPNYFAHVDSTFPGHMGLIQCIIWAANGTMQTNSLGAGAHSPLSRLLVRTAVYFYSTSDFVLRLIPADLLLSIDSLLVQIFAVPLRILIVWCLFVLHLGVVWFSYQFCLFGLLRRTGLVTATVGPSLSDYLKMDEYALLLANRLTDQEEVNSQLGNWVAQSTLHLHHLEQEKCEEVSSLNIQLVALQAKLCDVHNRLDDSVKHTCELETEHKSQISLKEEQLSQLRLTVQHLEEEKDELDKNWKLKLRDVEEQHQKAMCDSKNDREKLYSQAVNYYEQMTTLKSETDRLYEVCNRAEEKLTSTEAELSSLQTLFTTLKTFDIAIEQIHGSSPERDAVSSDSSDSKPSGVCENEHKSDADDQISMEQLNDNVPYESDKQEKGSSLSKLRTNLGRFLDVGRLHAELDIAKSQVKQEEARALCERELREQLESKIEDLQREALDVKALYIKLTEEKNTLQSKLDVLSEHFKEREFELQRDLGKHMAVGSESSEALANSRKRNRELEVEVKALHNQLTTLRRELAETERLGRRQLSELDKRSHENWLAARAVDHQLRELRDENTSLRQKLMEASSSALPTTLRMQQMMSVRKGPSESTISGVLQRPNIHSSQGKLDKRSLSGHSLTSGSPQPSVSRPDLPSVSFPSPPLPPPMAFAVPFLGPLANSQLPPPPFLPEFSHNRLRFPHGFPPPPPPMPTALASHLNADTSAQRSSNSSEDVSLCDPPFS